MSYDDSTHSFGSGGDDDAEGCLGFLALGLGLGLIAITWPVCWWSAVVGGLAYALHRLTPETKSFVARVLTALRNSALAVLVALGVLALAQIVFVVSRIPVETATIRGWEAGLAHSHFALKQLVRIEVIAVVLPALIVVQLATRGSILARVNAARTWIGRVALGLVTLSSFSFLYTARTEGTAIEWRTHLKEEGADELRRFEAVQRELVVLAQIEAAAQRNPAALVDFAMFVRGVQSETDALPIVVEAAQQTAERRDKAEAPTPEATAATRAQPEEDRRPGPEVARAWVEAVEVEGPPPPEAERYAAEAEREVKNLLEVRKAAVDTVAATIVALLPIEVEHTLVKAYVSTIMGILAKESVSEVAPRSVDTLGAARLWSQLTMTQPDPRYVQSLDLSRIELVTPKPEPREKPAHELSTTEYFRRFEIIPPAEIGKAPRVEPAQRKPISRDERAQQLIGQVRATLQIRAEQQARAAAASAAHAQRAREVAEAARRSGRGRGRP